MEYSAPRHPVQPSDVIDHWFGTLNADGTASEEALGRWFGKNTKYDAWLTTHFGPVLEKLGRGDLGGWLATAFDALAYILVADQMSRNIHRGSGAMYDHDDKALAATRKLIESGGIEHLQPMHRYFVLMPLMHAEDVALQRECVERFEQEADRLEGPLKKTFAMGADYAQRHAVIVERFGRFPHRNALLGRESTAEEEAFLQEPGSSF